MKIAIYAHFSPTSRVMWYAWNFLENLRQLGFRVIFVSNSLIDKDEVSRLEGQGIEVMTRKNLGLDFGMWQAALKTLDMNAISELLLTNSSIAGPIRPLAPIFEEARTWDCDFWGMTDNCEIGRHLQSYFLVFSGNVIGSKAFKDFWDSVLLYGNKEQIIASYEVGLTIWLEEQGFKWRPLVYLDDVWSSYKAGRTLVQRLADRIPGRPLPKGCPTLFFPELLLKMGIPFLKSSVLRHGSRGITRENAAKLYHEITGELVPETE